MCSAEQRVDAAVAERWQKQLCLQSCHIMTQRGQAGFTAREHGCIAHFATAVTDTSERYLASVGFGPAQRLRA